jgi:hypothetical protein
MRKDDTVLLFVGILNDDRRIKKRQRQRCFGFSGKALLPHHKSVSIQSVRREERDGWLEISGEAIGAKKKIGFEWKKWNDVLSFANAAPLAPLVENHPNPGPQRAWHVFFSKNLPSQLLR